MTTPDAIILGLTQGLTEFIPVSSSGHLVLVNHFLHVEGGGLTFDAALNIGTLAALIIYFYKDIWQLIRAIFTKQKETRLAWLLVAATIPAAIAGILLEKPAETAFRSPLLVAINLMVVAGLMLGAEWFYAKHKDKGTQLNDTSPTQAMVMGVSQAAALLPGVSRSGSTITAGLFAGMDRVSAMRFSFLLGIPILSGGVLKKMTEQQFAVQFSAQQHLFIIGILTAFVSGIFAIKFMLSFLSKHSLSIFAYYRIALGLLVIGVLILQ